MIDWSTLVCIMQAGGHGREGSMASSPQRHVFAKCLVVTCLLGIVSTAVCGGDFFPENVKLPKINLDDYDEDELQRIKDFDMPMPGLNEHPARFLPVNYTRARFYASHGCAPIPEDKGTSFIPPILPSSPLGRLVATRSLSMCRGARVLGHAGLSLACQKLQIGAEASKDARSVGEKKRIMVPRSAVVGGWRGTPVLVLRGGGKGGCKAKHLSNAKEGRRIMAAKHGFPGLVLGAKHGREEEEAAAKGALTAYEEEGMRDLAEGGSDDDEEEEADSFPSYSSDEPAQAVAEMKKRVQTSREILPSGGEIPLTAAGCRKYGAVELSQTYQGRPIKIMRHPRPSEHGNVWAWGSNYDGQLGLGDGCKIDRHEPMRLMFLPPGAVRGVSAGTHHSLLLRDDGSVLAFGLNCYGQLGDGSLEGSREPQPVQGLPGPATSVAAGGGHSLAVVGGGTVYSWGRCSEGQLGCCHVHAAPGGWKDEDEPLGVPPASKRHRTWTREATKRAVPAPCAIPMEAFGGEQIETVSAGKFTSLALDASGGVWLWGGGQEGCKAPARVAGLPVEKGMFLAIAAGDDRGMALDRDGGVWQFGAHAGGGMSEGAERVQGLSKVMGIAAGGGCSVALEEEGRVVWWGRVSGADSAVPVRVEGLTGDVKAVTTSGECLLAMGGDGCVYAWGGNPRGQCGAGERHAGKTFASPRRVKRLTGCTAISAGGAHVLALQRPPV